MLLAMNMPRLPEAEAAAVGKLAELKPVLGNPGESDEDFATRMEAAFNSDSTTWVTPDPMIAIPDLPQNAPPSTIQHMEMLEAFYADLIY